MSVSSQLLLQKYKKQQQLPIGTATIIHDGASDGDDDDEKIDPFFLLNKIRTEYQASQPISPNLLQILYCDQHICVISKPSGVLSVPGPRRNPSMATLVYDMIPPDVDMLLDQTVVHRLDMATSGILVFARTLEALSQLHSDFEQRRVFKVYECLVHGHLTTHCEEGEIDVALERDPNRPPFMRIAQWTTKYGNPTEKNDELDNVINPHSLPSKPVQMQHKFWREAPKPSLTQYQILGYEYYHHQNDENKIQPPPPLPVTRLEMKPWTGRTHQLRVHAAQALGAPIIGDEIYGTTSHQEVESLCLHAKKLCIYHPISGAPMMFEVDAPF